MRIIITFLLFFSALLEYAEYTSILQFADYRLDRTKDYFFSRGGFKSLSKLHLLWKVIALFLIYQPIFDSYTLYIIFAVLLLDVLYRILFFDNNKFPTFTFRSFLTLFLPIWLDLVLVIFFIDKPFALFILLFRPIIFTATSIFLLPIFFVLRNYYIKKATRKMRTLNNLKVVGITGSFGKTTVKVFLSQILAKKFKVIHTPKNINTELGIAKFILQNDLSTYDIFIAEMGAYGRGEIEVMTKMTKPTVGILTTIIEQHLALFKKIENIQLAKFELLYSIPEQGTSIANIDNKYIKEFLPNVKSKIQTFGSAETNNPTCLIKEVIENEKGIIINFEINKENWQISAPLLGKHQAYNLASCVLAAISFGMSKDELIEACKTLKVPERTMRLMKYGSSILIDDSYNANPEGFIAALKSLDVFDKSYKKIIIARGMFELGDQTIQKHKEVGEEISKHSDKLILTTQKPGQLFEAGVDTNKTSIYYKIDSDELLKYLIKLKESKNVILLEHRLPEDVYEALLEDKELKDFQ